MTNVSTQSARDIICKHSNPLSIYSYLCHNIQSIFVCGNSTRLCVNALSCLSNALLLWNFGPTNGDNDNNNNNNNNVRKQ